MIYQASSEFAYLLERAGIRQKEMAEQIGMSRFGISHIAARRRNISGAFVARIAAVYSSATSITQDEAVQLLFVPVAEKKQDVSNRTRNARGRFAKSISSLTTSLEE